MRIVVTLLVSLAVVGGRAARAQNDTVDRDGDGIGDVADRCPDDPEDSDGFEDADGCPDDDNDGDRVPDPIDSCPFEPETKNGYQDDDGCPDIGPVRPPEATGACADGAACKAAGDAEWTAADYVGAARDYRRACALGDISGCGAYGIVVEAGKAVGLSLPFAAAIHRFACAARVRESCHNLGLMLRDGRGLVANAPAATRYFERACDLGLARACTIIGRAPPAATALAPAAPAPAVACSDGPSCGTTAWAAFNAKHFEDAARDGQKACDLGDVKGCVLLGHLFAQGKGVARDQVKALSYSRKACTGGEQVGCHNLAVGLAYGRGAAQDLKEARRLFEIACKGGLTDSCNELAALPAPDLMAPVLAAFDAKDYRTTAKLAKPLCDAGNMNACGTLGTARWELGAKKEAMTLWQQACDGGQGWACGELGSIYWDGDGVREDRVRALGLAKLGCERGDVEACRSAGSWGLGQDARSVDWFARACDLKDMDGCASAAHSYRAGDFGPKDAAEAVRFGRRACELGALRECAIVGLAECDGLGTARDVAACKRHLDQACKGGDEQACEDLHDRFP